MSKRIRMTWFYAVCRQVLVAATRVLFFLRVRGSHLIPRQGGCIIASNHVSYLDPPLLAVASPRMLCFMGKQELFKGGFGFLIRNLNAFPIRRSSSDVRAMRQAITKLKEGQVMIIFPEGTRSTDGQLGSVQPGVGMLAERAGVPVIPAYIDGAQRAWPNKARWPRLFVPIRVHFGPAVAWDPAAAGANDRDHYQAVADAIIGAIKKIKNNLS